MITGDHRDTAVAIARQLGILENADEALTGAQLGRLFRAIKRCRKKYPDWVLVEVKAHKGEEVTIKL